MIYKNYKLILFFLITGIFLYYSADKYEKFSIQKSISACAIAATKLNKDITPKQAREICEKEIQR
tara:strand:+ start:1304 stop:1498 length:195 start_codon:yes stop_codon:yes gene_type:complete